MDAPESTPGRLADIVRAHARRLADAGVADPVVDAELLAAHALGTSRGAVQAAGIRGDALTADQATRLGALVARRERREPLQHITGVAPFRHLELAVGPGVFVPRPETEILAQLAVDALVAVPAPRPGGVDLGTGSGAIALAMATEVPHAEVWAIERSAAARAWTERNIARYGDGRVHLVAGAFEQPPEELDGTIDVVASNPPYVPTDAVPRDPEVRGYDPAEALYGGPDGLDAVRVLATVGMRLARAGGVILLEHGEWQGEAVRGVLSNAGWRAAATHPDLTGRDRVTTAVRP